MFEPTINVYTEGTSIVVTVDDTKHEVSLRPILDAYFASKKEELRGAMGAPGESGVTEEQVGYLIQEALNARGA